VTELWIAGGRGAALEVWAVARALDAARAAPWRLHGFVTPDGSVAFDPEDLDVRDESAFLEKTDPARVLVVIGIGDPRTRAAAAARFAARRFEFATLVHPTAIVGPRCAIGAGSVLMANAVLETHVALGAHALVNVAATIAHNGVVGDFCSLGPGVHLAGGVALGDRCDLGVGCCVRPQIRLGPDTRVGAGAAVVRDHPGTVTLIGVPAEPLA